MNTKQKLEKIKKLVNDVENEISNQNEYQIPGIVLDDSYFNHSVIKNIPDPNLNLEHATEGQLKSLINYLINSDKAPKTLQNTLHANESEIVELAKEYLTNDNTKPQEIENHYEQLYQSYMNEGKDKKVLIQPTIGTLRDENHIYTSVYFFENYEYFMKKEDFKIYQNFTISEDGSPQLNYYVCFNLTTKSKGSTYRMRKFTIKNHSEKYATVNTTTNELTEQKLNIDNIKNIMVTVINEDPETSRGTVTTVTQPTSDD
ncbi:hypothetical protein KORDIASMS9_04213 [Kordia sp. SMS9]|uniref:hypothetical protein n=1 Tax=Kordia sp. SMS9 TaxID=2282170 RepID=UPI000E0D529D|nr:hypothetical protein [Kordia sp. SMS9]AXG71955.1 hypothetical protein KORDIASMS9_04213 [Kordia sp. SMS9]